MIPGDVVLMAMPRADGGPPRLRPALVLAELPGRYADVLVCGISTQLHQYEVDWDELMPDTASDLPASGLRQPSIIRLNHLLSTPQSAVAGIIGSVSDVRL